MDEDGGFRILENIGEVNIKDGGHLRIILERALLCR
jgi:hypothetical protein